MLRAGHDVGGGICEAGDRDRADDSVAEEDAGTISGVRSLCHGRVAAEKP